MVILGLELSNKAAPLPFTDCEVPKNLESVPQIRGFLGRDAAPIESQACVANVRAGKALREINEKFDFARTKFLRRAELQPHLFARVGVRKIQRQPITKPPPNGGIEQFLVIRGRDHDGLVPKAVDVLDEAVDYALQFSEFLVVTAKFCDSVKLIEEQDAGSSGGEIEQRADVFRCAAEKRRDQTVQSSDVQIQAEFLGDESRQSTFPGTGRPVHEQAEGEGTSINIELGMTLGDAEKFMDDIPLLL